MVERSKNARAVSAELINRARERIAEFDRQFGQSGFPSYRERNTSGSD